MKLEISFPGDESKVTDRRVDKFITNFGVKFINEVLVLTKKKVKISNVPYLLYQYLHSTGFSSGTFVEKR